MITITEIGNNKVILEAPLGLWKECGLFPNDKEAAGYPAPMTLTRAEAAHWKKRLDEAAKRKPGHAPSPDGASAAMGRA